MTGYTDCPYRKNIDCVYKGAVVFCRKCGFYPKQEECRKNVMQSNIGQIEAKRPNFIMQLTIRHKGKKVSYSVQPVRKRTPSLKTYNQLRNGQGDG